jgi:hypothetical protein
VTYIMSYTESTNRATIVKTVTSKLATSYLRHMVSAAGQSARAINYTLHSGRIGGATALAAVLRIQRLWQRVDGSLMHTYGISDRHDRMQQ